MNNTNLGMNMLAVFTSQMMSDTYKKSYTAGVSIRTKRPKSYNTEVSIIISNIMAIYKTRSTGTGNGVREARGMGESYIPGNVDIYCVQCRRTFRECSRRFWGI